MPRRSLRFFLILVAAPLLLAPTDSCGERAETVQDDVEEKVDTVKEDVEDVVEMAGYAIEGFKLSLESCEDVVQMSIRGGEGYGVPGVSGDERWGIVEGASDEPRVRRSWSTLSDAEKKQVVDGFVKLKQTTVGSGQPAAERADYETFCEGTYTRNLHDFYVELHSSAFVSMGKDDMPDNQMAHMGPKFLPWHRYILLRIEADLQEVLGDPDFALPYWDWEDCEADGDGTNLCPQLFETEFLGSQGSCDSEEAAVTGYLVDEGFKTNLWSQVDENTMFNIDGLNCSSKPLQRAVGCQDDIAAEAPSAEDVAGVFDREVYDAEPYDTCNTDEDVSMRQYLEGFQVGNTDARCVLGGCENHGRGHYFIGGDMGGQSTPNDPVFFLHHANVDRLWAMWQDENRASSETAVDYGNPEYPDDWRGSIFNFSEVRADEMFDFRALGFQYDTTE